VNGFQPLPPLSEVEFATLRDDIAAHGILQPVVVDQHGRLLDGHHRSQIGAELGINVPRVVEYVENDAAAEARALALNLARRHLTREQKRELIQREIDRTPTDSDRAIARRLACSPSTVAAVRRPVSKLDSDAAESQRPTDIDPDDERIADDLFPLLLRGISAELPVSEAQERWVEGAVIQCADNTFPLCVALICGVPRHQLLSAVMSRMALWRSRGVSLARVRSLFRNQLDIVLSDSLGEAVREDLGFFLEKEDSAEVARLGELAWDAASGIPRMPDDNADVRVTGASAGGAR
jgi:ParB-like chromosome segregation protein Spo0J